MWFKIKSYLLFLLKSTNKHGIHSPFVYNLVTKCFNTKTNKLKINLFKKIVRYFKRNDRKVSQIAKITGISKRKASLLIRLVEYFNSVSILELGSSLSLSAAVLSIANPKATITALENSENTAVEASKIFRSFNFNNINIVTGNLKNTLNPILDKTTFDLIYFNGNYKKDATLIYFEQCIKSIHNNSIFIFDDINSSKEMKDIWGKIKNHSKVKVTIDVYFWGIVFFREEQEKQHFTIRT
ncbi:class I SAM-dependent methyltransferase [Lutibacter citreus]|uniref:class I SAM-dependent methyltransferase n=1 Tax=Lutibacter citreus TaxID=2138210 RepID=UPI000DBE8CE2|nr:class I SAM-dependent methyltransferase [Lutibacter citreus]